MAKSADKKVQELQKKIDEFTRNLSEDSSMLKNAIAKETKGIKNPLQKIRKETEIREQWRLATEQTTAFSGFFKGLLGKELGSVFAKKFAAADEGKVKQAQNYFKGFM